MEENEIEIIRKSTEPNELSEILQRFLANNENQFTFISLSYENRRVILWTTLFQHLQNKELSSVHSICLATIRVLSRDNTSLEELLCERWITTLIERAGFYSYVSSETGTVKLTELPEKEIAVESLKCLCNLTFNSPAARAYCANTSVAQSLVARFQAYNDIPYKYDIMLYDMKLLFILTALRQDIKLKIINELDGMNHLTRCLKELLLESVNPSDDRGSLEEKQCVLSDQKLDIICEILKSQFNLIIHIDHEDIDQSVSEMYSNMISILVTLLHAQTSNNLKLMELHNNVANFLTSVPSSLYKYLTPDLTGETSRPYAYNGKDMHAIHTLLNLLQHQLSIPIGVKSLYENLSPILTVLNKSARGCRHQRKYLRQVVLPPLRDVSNPPEQGNTLRNQLCRLLTTHVTSVRDLVAEFLFVLCKENVGRMVKYTGFGNAAGHLAQKGLLNATRGDPYSSSSDSDTEEYREAAARIDPVVGCTRPPRLNPFEGMSDEQRGNTEDSSNADEEYSSNSVSTDNNEARSTSSNNNSSRLPKSCKTKRKDERIENEVLELVRDHFKRPRPIVTEDRCDIIGKNVAMKLRALYAKQILVVEKLINDLLFEAEIEHLTPEHAYINIRDILKQYQRSYVPAEQYRQKCINPLLLPIGHIPP